MARRSISSIVAGTLDFERDVAALAGGALALAARARALLAHGAR